jgi:hypothetical protein
VSAETGISTGPGAIGTWTAAPVLEVTVEFTDEEGERAITRSWWAAAASTVITLAQAPVSALQGAGQAIAAALQGLSAAQVTTVAVATRSYNSLLKPSAETAGPNNIEDKAFIEYASNVGGLIKMNVPTPLEAIFASDEETINPSSTGMAAYSTLAIAGTTQVVTVPGASGNLVLVQTDKNGVPINAYIKGYYRRDKTRRKVRQGISTEIGG